MDVSPLLQAGLAKQLENLDKTSDDPFKLSDEKCLYCLRTILFSKDHILFSIGWENSFSSPVENKKWSVENN